LTTSSDDGKTWTPPRDLPDGVLGPIKDKPIELPHHVILCPSSTEDQGWRVRFESTSDLGVTWKIGPFVNDPSVIAAIQPSLLSLGGNRLRAVGRTQQGSIFAIDSMDLGKTWGKMRLLPVPNPNSGIDALRLRDGRFVLVYNPSQKERTPLAVAISDDAERWHPALTLEDKAGEFSYPAVIQTHDGLIHITYTWNRRRIRHVVIDPTKLTGRSIGQP
jgi:predicted neuraminidase